MCARPSVSYPQVSERKLSIILYHAVIHITHYLSLSVIEESSSFAEQTPAVALILMEESFQYPSIFTLQTFDTLHTYSQFITVGVHYWYIINHCTVIGSTAWNLQYHLHHHNHHQANSRSI